MRPKIKSQTQICFLGKVVVAHSWYCHVLLFVAPEKLSIRAFFWAFVCFCTSNGSSRILKKAGQKKSASLPNRPKYLGILKKKSHWVSVVRVDYGWNLIFWTPFSSVLISFIFFVHIPKHFFGNTIYYLVVALNKWKFKRNEKLQSHDQFRN